jgi:hypothetical protein
MASDLSVSASAEPGIEDMTDLVNGSPNFTRSTAETSGAHSAASFLFTDDVNAASYRVKYQGNSYRYIKLAFAFRIKTLPTGSDRLLIIHLGNASWVLISALTVDASGDLEIIDSGQVARGKSGSSYSVDTWYWAVIESNWVSGTSHDVTVRTYDANGTAIENWSSTSHAYALGTPTGFGMGPVIGTAGFYNTSGAVYVDDISFWNHNTSWPTIPIRPMHAYLAPDGEGTDLWTGYVGGAGKYESVDDVTSDGDTTYVYQDDGGGDDYQGFTHEACGITTTIYGVELAVYARREGVGSWGYVKIGMRNAGTQVIESTWWATIATYGYRRYFRATDPDGNDWNAARLDATESEMYYWDSINDDQVRWTLSRLIAVYDGGVVTPSTSIPKIMTF